MMSGAFRYEEGYQGEDCKRWRAFIGVREEGDIAWHSEENDADCEPGWSFVVFDGTGNIQRGFSDFETCRRRFEEAVAR